MSASIRQASPLEPKAPPWGSDHRFDEVLVATALLLGGIGLVAVASASSSVAEQLTGDALHYLRRQSIAALLGIGIILILIRIPLAIVQRLSAFALFAGMALLILVLIPGIGDERNGSWRWISFGAVSLQASEPLKVAVILYVANYLVRHAEQVKTEFLGFIMPILMLTVVGALLLQQPDYGTAVVMFATALGMLFLGGVPVTRFFAWGAVALVGSAAIAVLAEYRLQRLTTFLDPWSDPFDSGFQLTQALIAFGRGEWFGVGLGSSIQKLFYLPEAHTDFIFAVIAEELGLAGTLGVLCGFVLLVWRIFHIGDRAARKGQLFAAHVAFGVGLLIGLQAFINIGVNMGTLPTKGLTLPFISYGTNSMIAVCAALGLVLRVALETGTAGAAGVRSRARDADTASGRAEGDSTDG